MTLQEARATYNAASLEGARICNAAHAAAARRYDQEIARLRALYPQPKHGHDQAASEAFVTGMLKADRAHDRATQAADAIYAEVMREAGEALARVWAEENKKLVSLET